MLGVLSFVSPYIVCKAKTMLVQRTICINIGQFVIVTGQIVASNFK